LFSKSGKSSSEPLRPVLQLLQQLTALVLVSCLMPATSAFAAVGVTQLSSQPGRLVDIGTHRLHIWCVGSGQPTVVIDSGLGGNSLEWIRVQRSLAPNVRVCSYDRAGYGWSEPGPLPRTSSRIVDELFTLLKNADIAGPYVLVGHSFGGYTMQLFANRYPSETAGLVLVDSSHPEQFERFLAPPIRVNLAPSGRNRIMMLSPTPPVPENLPDEVKSLVRMLNLKGEARAAMGHELLDFRLSAQQVRNASDLPDVPMVVLTRGKRVWPKNDRGQHMERLWTQLQVELASRVQRTTHIVAQGSGHHIHLDQPELVADSVHMIVDLVRSGGVYIARDLNAPPAI
jgi:pimeloyl-ACP methyl ester carboxylesterase